MRGGCDGLELELRNSFYDGLLVVKLGLNVFTRG
jgi:hypothetical protein